MAARMWPVWVMLTLALLAASCGGATGSDEASAEADASGEDVTATEEIESGALEPVEPGEAPSTTATPTVPETDDLAEQSAGDAAPITIEEVNAALGRGMNFGNSLEAPREGDWGAGLDARYFQIIAEAGFDHVRLPISWANYADLEPPYTIPDGDDPTVVHPDYNNIWERVDWAIDRAEANGLFVIVNMHHYDEIHQDPVAERDRFLGMWEQISARYADAGDHVVLELLNEPNTAFDADPELWNDLAAEALAVVREDHPSRPVLIGPVGFNAIGRLNDLVLPNDPNIIVTVHVYEPFDFTHQGATWINPVRPLGTRWSGQEPALPNGVFNYSWDTQTIAGDGTFTVIYDRQWAGFSLDYQRGVEPNSISFDVAGSAEVRVLCRVGNDDQQVITILTKATANTYDVDLSDCPAETTGVSLQNAGENAEPLVFTSMVICTDRGCEEMFQSGAGAIEQLLENANAWGSAQGTPVHVGEFGAFSAEGQVPIADRAAWTTAVREASVRKNFSFAYWEFHAGFGAYDLDANAWVPELRDALLN